MGVMIDINLIAERRAAQQREQKIALTFLMVTAFLLVSLIVVWLSYGARLAAKGAQIKSAQKEIAKLKEAKKLIDAKEAEIQLKRPIVKLLEDARKSEREWLEVMRDVGNATPPGVWLSGLSSGTGGGPRVKSASGGGARKAEKTHNLTLRGQAVSPDSVAEFVKRLQRTESVQNAYINSITSQKIQNRQIYQFELVATLGKLIGVEGK